MIQLKDFGFLGVDSIRSRAYLSCLKKAGIMPTVAIEIKNSQQIKVIDKNCLFNSSLCLKNYFTEESYISLDTDDINAERVENILNNTSQKYWIYSGPAGVIVKKNIINTGKKLLHIHPGKVPNYRGSTTIYYSILMENNVFCSAFFLDEKIDTGHLIKTKEFSLPEDKQKIDYIYDPYYRACLLAEVLQEYTITEKFATCSQHRDGNDFFIIHPVLKHLAILRK